MFDKLILSYDIGTTYLKTGLLDTKFNILGVELEKYPVYFPKKGYAEQDPLDWWKAVVKTTNQLIEDENVFSGFIKLYKYNKKIHRNLNLKIVRGRLKRAMIKG